MKSFRGDFKKKSRRANCRDSGYRLKGKRAVYYKDTKGRKVYILLVREAVNLKGGLERIGEHWNVLTAEILISRHVCFLCVQVGRYRYEYKHSTEMAFVAKATKFCKAAAETRATWSARVHRNRGTLNSGAPFPSPGDGHAKGNWPMTCCIRTSHLRPDADLAQSVSISPVPKGKANPRGTGRADPSHLGSDWLCAPRRPPFLHRINNPLDLSQ